MASFPGPQDLPGSERDGWPWSADGSPLPPLPPGETWPPITLVVTSYNQAEFLEETLRSILLQGYPELELIAIDGGSTDESVQILERYEPWLDMWTSEPDRGQPDAINKGFARATGEIITFVASDDVYEPGTFFDVALRWRDHPDSGAIVGAFRFMNEVSMRESHVHPARLPGPGPHDLALMDTSLWRLHQVSTFYSRRALDQVGRWVREDLHYTMDRELLYRVCRRFPVVLSERTYAAFRRHPTSKSTTKIVPMMREMADLHWLDVPADEDPRLGRRRRALWRERRARGYFKLARSGVPWWRGGWALLRALMVDPGVLSRRHYFVSWLWVLGLRS